MSGLQALGITAHGILKSMIFGWVVAVFAVFWTASALWGIRKEYRRGERLNWLKWFSGFLIVAGALGFFGSALLALGVIRLSPSTEWPAGLVDGVVTSPNGLKVVPLEPTGRIQIYDHQWHFLRGWNVDASGGAFKVVAPDSETVDVFTARGNRHYTYSQTGQLLATAAHSEDLNNIQNGAVTVVVPTPPVLWPFSSPFLCGALFVMGFGGLQVTKKLGSGAERSGADDV